MSNALRGLRVLNTRPAHQAQILSKEINEAGGIAIECPTLSIKALNNHWLKQLPDLERVDYALFISANAVYHCFDALRLKHIIWPQYLKVIAIGQATRKALLELDINTHTTPSVSDSEHLLQLPELQHVTEKTLLLFKGEGGRELLEKELVHRGARVVTLKVYERILPEINPQFINSLWRDNLVDIILLTSEQSIFNLFKIFGKETHDWLQKKPCLVISKRLAQSASSLGMKKIIICHPEQMMDTLFDYSQGLTNDQEH